MAGLCAPLSTLRLHPRGRQRMTRGQRRSLLFHCGGLPPPTPCRFCRRTTFVRLSDAYLHEFILALLPQRSPPRPFTAAAWSGLRSAPESRSRGARPHLSRSFYSHGYSVHDEPPIRVLLQHTVKTKTDLAVNQFCKIQTSKLRRFESLLGFLARFAQCAKVPRVFTQPRPSAVRLISRNPTFRVEASLVQRRRLTGRRPVRTWT